MGDQLRRSLELLQNEKRTPIAMFEDRSYQALEVYLILRAFPGIGYKKAAMVTRDFIYRSKGWAKEHPWFDQIKGRFPRFEVIGEHVLDLPVDVHVRRILGRVVFGEKGGKDGTTR